ncbi:MAG: hypothetical protein EON54_13915, partial [Alcaligenaceae bacterium]
MNAVSTGAADSERSALNARARSGSIWIMGAFGAGQVLRLALNIVLAALLSEDAFALMAIITALLIGLAMFSDVGLQQNVVQSPRGDEPVFLNTVWTLQVIRGLLLAGVAAALSWPLSLLYGANDPAAYELRWLVPLAALSAIVDGFRSSAALLAVRHLKVARLTAIDVCYQVFNAIALLTLVWFFRSVYALVVGGLLSSVLHMALTYWMLSGPRPRFALEREAVMSIVSFGKWIFLSTLITFLAVQIDRLAFGAWYPLAEVGVYSIAASLAMVVSTLVGRLQSAIMFPWYSRVLAQGIGLADVFPKVTAPVLIMSSYLVALLAAGAGSFFELAYDHRYAHAAILLPVLAAGVWFSAVEGLYVSAFLALGRPQWVAVSSATKVVSFVLLMWLAVRFGWGLTMAAVMVSASEMIRAICCRYMGAKVGLRNPRLELSMLAMTLL